jgi:hypothetical protein
MEYILFLINRTAEVSSEKSEFAYEYSDDDIELMDKLENALQSIEVKRYGLARAVGHKALN